MSGDLGDIFSAPAIAAIERHTAVPADMCSLMRVSATRLLDSAQVIRDPLAAFNLAQESRVATPLPDFPVLGAVRQLIDRVWTEGFGPHAVRFFGLLGSVMIQLAGKPEHATQVSAWVAQGMTGTFCMTDRGGPLGSQWLTEATPGEQSMLRVDKLWAMNACEADFAIVIARRGRSMVLAPVLLPPSALASAVRVSSGAAFLDGQLPLGDLKWEGQLDPDWLLTQGGPIVPKLFLSLARPWLIQALCAHAVWLAEHGRLRLDATTRGCLDFLGEAARNQAKLVSFDRFSEDQAMALKWMANELWTHLIVTGAVPGMSDRRDLLGFAKMEGSSYRCFIEIYERNKRSRHVDA